MCRFLIPAYTQNNPVMNTDPTGYCSFADGVDKFVEGHDRSCGGIPATFGGFGQGNTSDTMSEGSTVDLSATFGLGVYFKYGFTMLTNHKEGFSAVYLHIGVGVGFSFLPSASFGTVLNIDDPRDYTGVFTYNELVAAVGGGYSYTPESNDNIEEYYTSLGVSFMHGGDYYILLYTIPINDTEN